VRFSPKLLSSLSIHEDEFEYLLLGSQEVMGSNPSGPTSLIFWNWGKSNWRTYDADGALFLSAGKFPDRPSRSFKNRPLASPNNSPSN
jgi:hypothetical protein